jgi:hypothetical protein
MTMNYDTGYLQRCRELIEEKLCWPPAGEWRDFEFTELSDKIFDSTSIQLSTTTLKRIFGKVKYDSLPSSATLNALAKYLGYENWMQFKAGQTTHEKEEPEETPVPKEETKTRRFSRKAMIGAAAILTVAVICGSLFLSSTSPSPSIETKDVIFKSKPLAEGLPNSVVFNIDLKDIKSDDVIIQQSWDSTRTVRLKPGQTEATAIYYVPGYFRAKLIVDKKIIKEHDLFIRSDNWMATIDNNPDPPTYLKKDELILKKGMHISASALDKIKKIESPATLTYHLVKPFGELHSDNFTLESSFQNSYSEGPAICKTTKLFILCTNGAFIIPFTIPGCASDINLKLGDQTWEGKSNDLSAFGIDPSQKINLKLEVKDRTVKIFCNGKLLREASYTTNAGDIVGLRYGFLGAGSVDQIRISDKEGKVVYSENFQ